MATSSELHCHFFPAALSTALAGNPRVVREPATVQSSHRTVQSVSVLRQLSAGGQARTEKPADDSVTKRNFRMAAVESTRLLTQAIPQHNRNYRYPVVEQLHCHSGIIARSEFLGPEEVLKRWENSVLKPKGPPSENLSPDSRPGLLLLDNIKIIIDPRMILTILYDQTSPTMKLVAIFKRNAQTYKFHGRSAAAVEKLSHSMTTDEGSKKIKNMMSLDQLKEKLAEMNTRMFSMNTAEMTSGHYLESGERMEAKKLARHKYYGANVLQHNEILCNGLSHINAVGQLYIHQPDASRIGKFLDYNRSINSSYARKLPLTVYDPHRGLFQETIELEQLEKIFPSFFEQIKICTDNVCAYYFQYVATNLACYRNFHFRKSYGTQPVEATWGRIITILSRLPLKCTIEFFQKVSASPQLTNPNTDKITELECIACVLADLSCANIATAPIYETGRVVQSILEQQYFTPQTYEEMLSFLRKSSRKIICYSARSIDAYYLVRRKTELPEAACSAIISQAYCELLVIFGADINPMEQSFLSYATVAKVADMSIGRLEKIIDESIACSDLRNDSVCCLKDLIMEALHQCNRLPQRASGGFSPAERDRIRLYVHIITFASRLVLLTSSGVESLYFNVKNDIVDQLDLIKHLKQDQIFQDYLNKLISGIFDLLETCGVRTKTRTISFGERHGLKLWDTSVQFKTTYKDQVINSKYSHNGLLHQSLRKHYIAFASNILRQLKQQVKENARREIVFIYRCSRHCIHTDLTDISTHRLNQIPLPDQFSILDLLTIKFHVDNLNPYIHYLQKGGVPDLTGTIEMLNKKKSHFLEKVSVSELAMNVDYQKLSRLESPSAQLGKLFWPDSIGSEDDNSDVESLDSIIIQPPIPENAGNIVPEPDVKCPASSLAGTMSIIFEKDIKYNNLQKNGEIIQICYEIKAPGKYAGIPIPVNTLIWPVILPDSTSGRLCLNELKRCFKQYKDFELSAETDETLRIRCKFIGDAGYENDSTGQQVCEQIMAAIHSERGPVNWKSVLISKMSHPYKRIKLSFKNSRHQAIHLERAGQNTS